MDFYMTPVKDLRDFLKQEVWDGFREAMNQIRREKDDSATD